MVAASVSPSTNPEVAVSSDLELDVAGSADGEAVADPPPAPEDAPPPDLTDVLAGLQGLRELFESKIQYDEVRARQVDSMHGELEQYRHGLTHEFLRPVLTDLVRLHDDLTAQAEGADDGAARVAEYVRGSIEETLARNGVESYTVDEPTVDRRRQKVIALVPTDDPALHRTVALRARPGYRFDDKILRPEWVHAYQLDPPRNQPDEGPVAPATDDVKESQ